MTKTTIGAAAILLAATLAGGIAGYAHDGHEHFSAGEPGDPAKPSRTVKVVMRESADGNSMSYDPSTITVRKGEQIRFVLENAGGDDHEFMLATVTENKKHGELMKKFPDMEHADPNAIRLHPAASGEILWTFTQAGEFEYACLIPDHYEAGMHGKIIVK